MLNTLSKPRRSGVQYCTAGGAQKCSRLAEPNKQGASTYRSEMGEGSKLAIVEKDACDAGLVRPETAAKPSRKLARTAGKLLSASHAEVEGVAARGSLAVQRLGGLTFQPVHDRCQLPCRHARESGADDQLRAHAGLLMWGSWKAENLGEPGGADLACSTSEQNSTDDSAIACSPTGQK